VATIGLLENDVMKKMFKKAVIDFFKLLFQYLPGMAKENLEKSG
jgi:hypothetical protein